jgi:uncharacterized protein (TIGR02266 family)
VKRYCALDDLGMSEMATDNRRQHSRVAVQFPTGVKPDADLDLEFQEQMLSDLSLGGCFIRTEMPEPPGAMVMVRFALPGAPEDESVKAVGRVCWTRDGTDGPKGMGIQFVRVTDADLGRLRSYISGIDHVAGLSEATA